MNILFEEKETVKRIDLDTLRKTTTLAEYTGKLPATRPLEHFQFIDEICERLDKSNHAFQVDPVWVNKGESKRIMVLDKKGVGAPESFLFQRLITRILLLDPMFQDGEKHNTAIALGYNERGLQVAFGTNVNVCANMCIFGGRYATTYGSNKMPFDKLFELVDKYINDLPKISEHDFQLLKRMNEVHISREIALQTIGDLQTKAVKANYFDVNHPAPLNISETTALTRGIIEKRPDLLSADQGGTIPLYDFYNLGTEILHPDRANTVTVWQDVSNWGNYVETAFMSS